MGTGGRDDRPEDVPDPDDRRDESPSPIQKLPQDALHQILSHLPLRAAFACAAACRLFRDALAAPPFPAALPPLRLLALRHPRLPSSSASLLALDPSRSPPRWIFIPLSFLPFASPPSPIAASSSLLYLWANCGGSSKSLVVCNPLARAHSVLPPLGSAWSRHGTVLAAPGGAAIVLTELAALSYSPRCSGHWVKYPLNLPSKPRSPILMSGSIYALCDVGSPWRSQWKLFTCAVGDLGGARGWSHLERHYWTDVFDILKRPRLIPGAGGRQILMIGGQRSSYAVDAPCSTVLILRLDIGTLEWEEAGRMPPEMYGCFLGAPAGGVAAAGASPAMAVGAGNNKVKVFGGHGRVWFSGKKAKGKLAMWLEDMGTEGGEWKWVDGVPGYTDGVYRGFVFDAGFITMP